MSQDQAINVVGLTKDYNGLRALDHATFEVPVGTICGFVGPNGSGKTTTIRMLLGLIEPSDGSGHVLGEPISHPERYLHSVGALIEGPAFYPALTGEENLRVLATLGGFPHSRIKMLLDVVGLGDRGGSKYKNYSLGMKQRLGIAAALLPEPRLLVLDEPTNGLDPAGIQEIRDLLEKLAKSGVTIFVSSHLLSEIEMISEYLVILQKGKVIFFGKTEDLLHRTKPTITAIPRDNNDLSKLYELAVKAGHDARIEGDELHIDADEEWGAELNNLAFQSGIILKQITPVRPTLEETFFAMTEEKE
ncbi:MAG: ATP-binding cassette domain-containing protein [Actinobacteria bacterium]|nr:ATP-binding cassette domain-containing protein [Actinomycetota bacterium]